MKLSSLCRDMNENIKYCQKSPERTTSISVTLKLLQCVQCSTGKNDLHEYLKIFMKIFID